MAHFLSNFFHLIYENSCLVCNQGAKDLFVCLNCDSSFLERKENHLKSFKEYNLEIFSWGYYEGNLRSGIIELKNGKKKLAKYFAQKIHGFWNEINISSITKGAIVIAVPSSKKRIKERGYCQTSLIAEEFAKLQLLKFIDNFVIRKKETSFMNKLENLEERQKNIKDAFELTRNFVPTKSILLIDDILTSGSTLCELSKTIHETYPEIKITGLTVAAGDRFN